MNTQDVINFVLNRLGNDNPILRELSNESKRTILEILEKEKPSIIKKVDSTPKCNLSPHAASCKVSAKNTE